MKEYNNVRSTVKPKEIEIDEYSVWVTHDIREVTVTEDCEEHMEYEFNQIQYSKDEYIQLLDEQNKALENQVTNAQMALCDIYEMIGG